MPRRHVPILPGVPYFITARCINKEWFRIPIDEVWGLFENYLYFLHHGFDVKIHAFVLMSNHYHMIATPQEHGLSEGMNYMMRETSRIMSRSSKRINQVYGAPFHRSMLSNEHSFRHAYKYTYRNPVDAGLSRRVETYPYSTLSALLGQRHTIIPIQEDLLLFENPEAHLEWLNYDYQKDHREQVRKALKKSQFQLALSRKDKKPSPLETDLS